MITSLCSQFWVFIWLGQDERGEGSEGRANGKKRISISFSALVMSLLNGVLHFQHGEADFSETFRYMKSGISECQKVGVAPNSFALPPQLLFTLVFIPWPRRVFAARGNEGSIVFSILLYGHDNSWTAALMKFGTNTNRNNLWNPIEFQGQRPRSHGFLCVFVCVNRRAVLSVLLLVLGKRKLIAHILSEFVSMLPSARVA